MTLLQKTCWVLLFGIQLAGVVPANAATYPARVVSRANCLVPLPKLSLVQADGYTFNESISWDPLIWRPHASYVQSVHYRSVFAFGFWSDYVIRSYSSGSLDTGSWRVWAGSIDRGDTRELFRGYVPHRSVRGNHLERYDNTNFVDYQWTGAFNCNLLTW